MQDIWLPVALGLGAALAGVGVMLAIPLGLFNRLVRVAPDPSVVPASAEAMRALLLGLNSEALAWTITAAPAGSRADLVAEWRLADAAWWGVLNRSGLRRSYRVSIRLVPSLHEVRIFEESGTVSWSAGAGVSPLVHWSMSFFRGIVLFERAREIAYGITEVDTPRLDRAVDYDFDPWRLKGPILRVAVEHGWAYAPVVHERQLGSHTRE